MENVLLDWGRAIQVGGIGFGVTVSVLIILAVAIWLTGFLVSKTGIGKDEAGNKKKGD